MWSLQPNLCVFSDKCFHLQFEHIVRHFEKEKNSQSELTHNPVPVCWTTCLGPADSETRILRKFDPLLCTFDTGSGLY